MALDFIPAPREFSDQPICNAIEAKDFKKALKMVEKKVSKKSDPYLMAMKCFVQCWHPNMLERGMGIITIMALARETDASRIGGIDELELYDEALKAVFPNPSVSDMEVICKARLLVVKASPKDEKLALACFRACLERDCFGVAQEITLSLQTNFPTNRAYQFWGVTMAWILADHYKYNVGDLRTTIFSRLAKRQMDKLVEAVEAAGPDTKVVNPFQTPQELLLLHRLVKEDEKPPQERRKRGLKLYANKHLGTASKAAKGSWQLKRNHILLLEEDAAWSALFEECHKMLENSRPKNGQSASDTRGADWLVWKCYMKALRQLYSQPDPERSYFDRAMAELTEHIALDDDPSMTWSAVDKTYARNAHLARLRLLFFSQKDLHPHVSEASSELITVCLYIKKRAGAPSLFGDIRPLVEFLTYDESRQLLGTVSYLFEKSPLPPGLRFPSKLLLMPADELSSFDQITAQATVVKLVYLLLCSIAPMARQKAQELSNCKWCKTPCKEQCRVCLTITACMAMEAYGTAFDDDGRISETLLGTDLHPADDLLIVTVMCLVKLAEAADTKELGNRHFFQAAAILEYGLLHSKANPQFALLLIRIYTRIGAGSLAVRAYKRLGIKQVQGDTLGYVLFDRISTLHPHPVSHDSIQENPCDDMLKMQGIYRRFRGQVRTNVWKSFEHGSYDSIFQLMEASQKLARSAAAAMLVIELRKIKRLTESKSALDRTSFGYDVLPPAPASQSYSDNSDYGPFPNYECSSSNSFERILRFAPAPSTLRCQIMLLADNLWTMVTGPVEQRARRNSMLVQYRKDFEAIVEAYSDLGSTPFLTEVEVHYTTMLFGLSWLITSFFDPSQKSRSTMFPHVTTTLKAVLRGFRANIDGIDVNNAQWFPSHLGTLEPLYTAYETVSLICAVVQYIKKSEYVKLDDQDSKSLDTMEAVGRELVDMVLGKGEKVRIRLNKGSWLDFVLGNITTPDTVKALGEDDPGLGTQKVNDLASVISKVCDRDSNFLETFSGEVVESWRESVMGLVCLSPL